MKRFQRMMILNTRFDQHMRSLSSEAMKMESEHYAPLLKTTLDQLTPREQDVFTSSLSRLKRVWPSVFTEEDLHRCVVTQKIISIISSHKPNDRVLTMMIDLANIFNELFVVGQTDDFIRFLLQINKPDELRCQEILSSPETLRAFLSNINDFKLIPDKIGTVLEALLSALGKAMYKIDEQVRSNPQQILDGYGQTLLNIMNKYDFQSYSQPYLRGPEGYFFDIAQSVAPGSSSDLNRVAPDLVPLKTLEGKPLIKGCKGLWFCSASTGWIGHAIRGGIPLQYGPSGTTGASLTAICLIMRSKGQQNFVRQGLDEIMPLVVQSVMLPYLQAGYHSFVEVMVAVICYVNMAQKQSLVIPSPMICQKEAFHYVLQSMASSPDHRVVEKLSHALNTYYEFCMSQYALGSEDDTEQQPHSRF